MDRLARIEEVVEDDEGAKTAQGTSKEKIPVLGSTREAPQRKYPPHPSNTEEAWKTAQRERCKTRVKDEPEVSSKKETETSRVRMSSKTTPVRFTSEVQESVSLDAVQEQILNTRLTISLRDVLAMSPYLQKKLGNLVRTRREYEPRSVQDGEACALTCFDVSVRSEQSGEEPGSAKMEYGRNEDLEKLLDRYANAIVLRRTRLYAMSSGLVHVVFGGQRAVFLVDTGSELNLVSRHMWEASGLKVDKDGARWSLKGLGGEDVPLLGCSRDAPVQLGGKNFDHHFFVCSTDKGRRYDGIIGQPWLEWYAVNIGYSRGGEVTLEAFIMGDRDGASISVPIVKAEDPRNFDHLVLTSQACHGPDFV
ncbi:hypothetical protein TRAPUB_13515 [Trametes pubescens]|uniref:Peptidase A2 domain-containing protein n=1 Tax=Trametes pubescens TaxID=154538 RepID=A0A1M2VR78_TRAPU|nr:hypothetical protein TRAPUB_13515 [Trametes pubescens]